jgi:hypothetical protein
VSRKPPAARTAGPVGRGDVLAELRRVVDEAVAGRGHLLLLAGEAGIGKTTMLTAAAGFAEGRGVRVAWGWGWPGEGAPGYWPWVQVMRILGLDIPWPAEDSGQPVREAPASERFRLFDEVTSLLLAESRIQPLLLLLDDLQWADQPSQLLLDFLARRLPAGAVAVVGGYRDTEPAPGPAPGPVLAALAARTTVLPLTGLGPDAVGDLVADVVGEQRAAEVAAGVHRRTGGNPFFVQQVSWLLRSGQEGIPPGVHEAMELRFAALPGAAAAALRTAAVIGQRFSADLVALVSGQPSGAVAEALAVAVRARVVSRDGAGTYRFAHDLFREYADDQLPAAERASLHRRIGQGEAAGQAYLRAAGLARTGKDPAALARAALGLHAIGTRTWWPPDQVVALLSEALDAFGPGSDGKPLRLHVMASLSRALAWHGLDPPRARALAAQAVAAARAAGDPVTLAGCLLAQHHAIWAAGTARDRLRITAEVAGLAERSGDQEILLEVRLLAATDRLELADPGFRAELDEFIRLAGASRQPRFRYAALARRAALALLAGRLAEAERLIGQAEMLGEECGEPGVRDVRYDQGWDLLTAQGRLGELGAALPEMFPDPESPQARGARALVMLASGARAAAAEAAAPLLTADPGTIPPDRQRLLGLAYAAELVVAFGAVPVAEQLYAALLPFEDEAVVSGAAITFKGAVAHYLGLLAAVLGRSATAAGHLERAVAIHDRLDAAVWSLRSRYQLATVWLGEPGRQAAAVSALAEVAAAARTLGLAQLAREAEAAGFAAGQVPVTEGVFAREGAMWTLSYCGVTARMRDAKGLSDLAVLLAVPGRQVPAADLIAAAGAGQAGLADLRMGADEVLDATARRQIRARLASLGEDIAEAESWNDPERAALARAERDALLRELAAAAAPSGQPRLLGDQSERARKAVTARIRDVIGRLEPVHPALAGHLRESVTTGTRCSYSPPTPVSWRL